MASPVADQLWLAWIERLLKPSSQAHKKEARRSEFHCQLDDQPDHLVPASYLRPERWEGSTDRPLYLNPRGHFDRDLKSSDPSDHLFWVDDDARAMSLPFSLSPALRSIIEKLESENGRVLKASSRIPPRTLRTLLMAGILIQEDQPTRDSETWSKTVSQISSQFRTRGFAPVRGLIHPFHISALRRYYRWQIRNGRFPLGDGQSPLRYAAHNDPAARFFHQQFANTVSALAGQRVKPSYSYVASYQSGAALEKHTDREQCAFTLSVCIDYAPEPRQATPWPLHLHPSTGTVAIYQSLGDALLYRGREIPHSRHKLPAGHTSTSIFFHYVPEDFAGSLD